MLLPSSSKGTSNECARIGVPPAILRIHFGNRTTEDLLISAQVM